MKKLMMLAMLAVMTMSAGAQTIKMSSFVRRVKIDTNCWMVVVHDSAGYKVNRKMRMPFAYVPDTMKVAVVLQVAAPATWDSAVVSLDSAEAGAIQGTVYYKRNLTSNILRLRGTLRPMAANQLYTTSSSRFYELFTLPVGYRPVQETYFTVHYSDNNVTQDVKDEAGIAWLREFTAYVGTDGIVRVNLLRPLGGLTTYRVEFNCSVPLD